MEPFSSNGDKIGQVRSLLLPALSHPDQANRLFVDYVLLAVGAHIAQTYGGMRPVSRLVQGGLAPWQERRAKEMIAANLDGVPVKELARECGFSTAHFCRAFRLVNLYEATPAFYAADLVTLFAGVIITFVGAAYLLRRVEQ